ncbi:MAG: hypothetical protein JO112_10625 [Planctomycetes bacterium]|nr:hypothetical protein [Planctomycetota bacterium]
MLRRREKLLAAASLITVACNLSAPAAYGIGFVKITRSLEPTEAGSLT